MPISFEQPGPFDAGISSDYGAAQAMKDFAPFLSRAYGAHGGNASGGGGGRGGGGFPGMGGGGGGGGGVLPAPVDPVALYAGQQEVDRYFQQQDAQQAIRAIQGNTAGGDVDAMNQQIQDLQDRQASAAATADAEWQAGGASQRPDDYTKAPPDEGGDWGGGGTGEDQNIDQASAQQAEQQAQTAAPSQPPEFTQADALQLQRLTASRAEVQAQLRNGAVDQGTARRMIQQLQIPISVLRQQQQAMQTAAMQQEMQQRQHAAAEATTIENMNDQQRSQWIQRRTVRLPNGGWGYVDRKGDIKPLPQDHLDRQAAAAQRQEITPAHRITISNHVNSDMTRERQAARDLPPSQQPEWMKSDEAMQRERERRIREEIRNAQGDRGTGATQSDGRPQPRQAPNPQAQQRLESLFGRMSMPPMTPEAAQRERDRQRVTAERQREEAARAERIRRNQPADLGELAMGILGHAAGGD